MGIGDTTYIYLFILVTHYFFVVWLVLLCVTKITINRTDLKTGSHILFIYNLQTRSSLSPDWQTHCKSRTGFSPTDVNQRTSLLQQQSRAHSVTFVLWLWSLCSLPLLLLLLLINQASRGSRTDKLRGVARSGNCWCNSVCSPAVAS